MDALPREGPVRNEVENYTELTSPSSLCFSGLHSSCSWCLLQQHRRYLVEAESTGAKINVGQKEISE